MPAIDTIGAEPSRPAEPNGSAVLRIANAMGRIHKQFAGRGPTSVRCCRTVPDSFESRRMQQPMALAATGWLLISDPQIDERSPDGF